MSNLNLQSLEVRWMTYSGTMKTWKLARRMMGKRKLSLIDPHARLLIILSQQVAFPQVFRLRLQIMFLPQRGNTARR
jgi:hypothetical protein